MYVCRLIVSLVVSTGLRQLDLQQQQQDYYGQLSHSPIQPIAHRGAFCRFPFRWMYYCHSSKSTGEKTGKTHLNALSELLDRQATVGRRRPTRYRTGAHLPSTYLLALNSLHTLTYMGEYESAYRFCSSSFLSSSSSAQETSLGKELLLPSAVVGCGAVAVDAEGGAVAAAVRSLLEFLFDISGCTMVKILSKNQDKIFI